MAKRQVSIPMIAIAEQVATVLQEILWFCIYLWIMTDNEDDVND